MLLINGMGGAVGLGSLIYALVRCSQFLGETTLMEDAKQLATLITPDLIAADRNLDITAGAAGTIMGLLTLYNAIAEQSVLTTAISCGEHLLKYRSQSESGIPTLFCFLMYKAKYLLVHKKTNES
ncbi:MAG: hypothetical protein PUP92_11725 [Rhizonema sp. PD38]|nr:hypothetical protein [Rhizonema sp. PD38]